MPTFTLPHAAGATEAPRYSRGLPVPVAPPASVILLLAFGLMLLGIVLRNISGMMDLFTDSTKVVFWIGNLMLSVGLFGAAWAMFNYGLKDKELAPSVRTGAMLSGVLLILLGIAVSSNLLGQFGNVIKAGTKAGEDSLRSRDDYREYRGF